MITADVSISAREISNELEISAKNGCEIHAKVAFTLAETVPFYIILGISKMITTLNRHYSMRRLEIFTV